MSTLGLQAVVQGLEISWVVSEFPRTIWGLLLLMIEILHDHMYKYIYIVLP